MSYRESFWFNSKLLHGGREVNKGKEIYMARLTQYITGY